MPTDSFTPQEPYDALFTGQTAGETIVADHTKLPAEALNALRSWLVANFAGAHSVVDYGAVGDGTTDDTAAVQAAFDAADPDGVVIFPPGGTYRVTDLSIADPASFTVVSLGATLDVEGGSDPIYVPTVTGAVNGNAALQSLLGVLAASGAILDASTPGQDTGGGGDTSELAPLVHFHEASDVLNQHMPIRMESTGVLSVGTKPMEIVVHAEMRNIYAIARVASNPVGSAVTFNIEQNSTTELFASDLSIAANTAEVPATRADQVTSLAQGDYLRIIISAVGSGTAGSNLSIVVYGDVV